MQPEPVDIVHFHNGSGGGVLSVINNLLLYRQHQHIRNHIIFTINKNTHSHFILPVIEGAASIQVFHFSPLWNFYTTCRRLAVTLPSDRALIVAHDWLELGMVSNLGLQNPVVQVLHGDYDYYYQLAQKHQSIVENFITVTSSIKAGLTLNLPQRALDIFYCRFPVGNIEASIDKQATFSLVFVGRCTPDKGYHLLPEIAARLKQQRLTIQWHIVGNTATSLNMQREWEEGIEVIFYGMVSNKQVSEILAGKHLFILPSLAEGMPVAMIEGMKTGVVPVVNDLPGGIRELIENGETGYRVSGNNIEAYVEKIKLLCTEEELRKKMSRQAMDRANDLFNPVDNTLHFEKTLLKTMPHIPSKKKQKIYGSRLDQPWLPNFFVKSFRALYNSLN